MAFFNWAAPLFHRFGDRWSAEDAEGIAAWLRPYVPEGGLLLDLGGGTGALAAHLADALRCRVTVLDATPEMLAYLPERDDVSGIGGCAEAMPFHDDSFDAVVVSDAFHHFGDQDGAVREMQRVVRCGGGVLVLELDREGGMRLVVLGREAPRRARHVLHAEGDVRVHGRARHRRRVRAHVADQLPFPGNGAVGCIAWFLSRRAQAQPEAPEA